MGINVGHFPYLYYYRITGKAETLGGVTDNYAYTYDTAGRLTDVLKNGVAVGHYEYDSNSNRLSYTGWSCPYRTGHRV